MDINELRDLLNEQDRDFILKFFNMTSDFKISEAEFDIDADLENNFELFFTFCDFIYEHKRDYHNLKDKLKDK